MARRTVMVLAAAVLWAGAGSAVLTSSAFAGGVDGNGTLSAAVYNSTPYTWTLVAAKSISSGSCLNRGCLVAPAGTLGPGGGSLYSVYPTWTRNARRTRRHVRVRRVLHLPGRRARGSAGVHHRRDLPGLLQRRLRKRSPACRCGTRSPRRRPATTRRLSCRPAPQTANPQLAVQLNTPTLFDPTISAVGNFNVDASTDLGQPFVDLLNSACAARQHLVLVHPDDADHVRPRRRWGTGVRPSELRPGRCAPAGRRDRRDRPTTTRTTTSSSTRRQQSASLSVGGGVTAEHRVRASSARSPRRRPSASRPSTSGRTSKTFARSAKVYIPSNSWGFLWAAPTIGRVTGTIVATIGAATYTATNFTTRSRVSGHDRSAQAADPGLQHGHQDAADDRAERVEVLRREPGFGDCRG